ncbi:PQQ-dependent sugar dehydrogenase [Spongiimicrobium sp. 3-5]|uniref:PQQ-dependent sugar dehydrogenase n=1 Tax=Spongiimicrobium sp. 3-5 TaxID=3332596 RepID=UPI00397F0678
MISIIFTVFLSGSLAAQVTFELAYPNISFDFPVEITTAGDGTNRMFVVEQPGLIKVFPNSISVSNSDVDTFLDLSQIVSYSEGQEIGLLGLAFHPNYSQNGFFYVYYTQDSQVSGINEEIVLARYTVSAGDPNIADPGSELVIFSFDKNQDNSNHNGGKIAFGPDGYLYISVGDGGGAGDPQGNGQNLSTVFGSILRIDIDLDGSNPVESNPDTPNGNYEIPANNPRVGQSGLDELFAWGIRNTWKFSFDAQTGRLWGSDVGQDANEEINLINIGENYGWNRFEAFDVEDGSTDLVTTPDTKPVFFYDHNSGDVSITGGYVYRGSSDNPSLQGKYIYGDFASGRVWSLDYNASNNTASSEFLFRTNGEFISSFGLDEFGELYFSDYNSSASIYKIVGGTSGPQTVTVTGIGSWNEVGGGTNGIVESITRAQNGSLYFGGEFTQAGGNSVNNLAIYDTNTGWSAFGSGANGKVNSIAIGGDGAIYVGGDFSEVGGIPASNIAVWNGSIWSPLGTGTNGPVAKIEVSDSGEVYVGGAFETAGGITVNNIALWNNGTWQALTDSGSGTSGTNNEVRAIAFDENNVVYVGGNFDSAGGNSASRIATWDGQNWSTLGSGTSGFVQAIAVTSSHIYAGGNFAIAGFETVNRIAKWNRSSSQWEALGQGLSGNVRSLVHDGTNLFVGGSFQTASDVVNINKIVNNVARWSQNLGWQALGINFSVGVDTQINSLILSSDQETLYAGGNFSAAGQTNALNVALWGLNFNCSDNSIVPEYRLDGTWFSGQSELTVASGTEVVLSMLPNGIGLTITLPDGSQVGDDYNLGNVSSSEQGVYTLTSEEGCSETFSLIVSASDADGDGIPDALDQCPNTPSGVVVGADGCQIFTLPADNFELSVQGTSCRGLQDGRIEINPELNLDYNLNLTGTGTAQNFTFENGLQIENLAPGSYDLCITVQGLPDFESCFKAIVNEPESLEVSSVLNSLDGSVTLSMSGGSAYFVTLNENSFRTTSNEVKLVLTEKENLLEVTTDKSCQGKYKDTIMMVGEVEIFPNPFQDILNLEFSGRDGNAELNLYANNGMLIVSSSVDIANGVSQFDFASLPNGIYVLAIIKDGLRETFKVVKR